MPRPRLVFSPWVAITGGVLTMAVSGSMYMFSALAPTVKATLELNTAQVNLVSSSANFGAWGSFLTGAFYDRCGPRASGFLSATLLFLGYGGLWLSCFAGGPLNPFIRAHKLTWLPAVFAFLFGAGSGLGYTLALNTTVANFKPTDRGTVVGILVSGFGLSGGIFVVLLRGFWSTDVVGFLLALTLITSAMPLIWGGMGLLNFVRGAPIDYTATYRRLPFAFGIAITCAVWVAGTSVAQALFAKDLPAIAGKLLAGGLLGLLGLFFAVPIGAGPIAYIYRGGAAPAPGAPAKKNKKKKNAINGGVNDDDDDEDEEEDPVLYDDRGASVNDHIVANDDDALTARTVSGLAATGENKPKTAHDGLTIWQTLRTLNFWSLFAIFFLTIGPAIMAIDNFAAICLALAPGLKDGERIDQAKVPTLQEARSLIALFSVFNTCGRLSAGVFSDKCVAQAKANPHPTSGFWPRLAVLMTREAVLATSVAGMTLTMIIFALAQSPAFLWPATMLMGLSYGGLFLSLPTITVEHFGLAAFGVIFGVMGLAPAAGSELLGVGLAGSLSDHFAKDKSVTVLAPGGETTPYCVGWHCFGYTFLVGIALCLVSLAVAISLVIRVNRAKARAAAGGGSYSRLQD